MYTLRIIEETRDSENDPFEQVVENFSLGNSYAVLKNGTTKEFDRVMSAEFPETERSHIKALICGENKDVFFVEENEANRNFQYYIMTECGKTFERL